jgi:hypothetical protein
MTGVGVILGIAEPRFTSQIAILIIVLILIQLAALGDFHRALTKERLVEKPTR